MVDHTVELVEPVYGEGNTAFYFTNGYKDPLWQPSTLPPETLFEYGEITESASIYEIDKLTNGLPFPQVVYDLIKLLYPKREEICHKLTSNESIFSKYDSTAHSANDQQSVRPTVLRDRLQSHFRACERYFSSQHHGGAIGTTPFGQPVESDMCEQPEQHYKRRK